MFENVVYGLTFKILLSVITRILFCYLLTELNFHKLVDIKIFSENGIIILPPGSKSDYMIESFSHPSLSNLVLFNIITENSIFNISIKNNFNRYNHGIFSFNKYIYLQKPKFKILHPEIYN